MRQDSLSPQEIEKFDKLAHDWWNPRGKFKPLHDFNPIRVEYIRQMANLDLSAKTIIDVGCGGGLVAAQLSRLGGKITAIDGSPATIYVAQKYANQANLPIDFHQLSPEGFLAQFPHQQFDMVAALEIIEHVDEPAEFLQTLKKLLKPDGIMILSTLNRNIRSWLMAILGAEYIMRMLPVGTHEWQKFIKPNELIAMARDLDLTPINLSGMVYNPFNQKWTLSDHDFSVNYLLSLKNYGH